jgi:hypothetical protein
MRIIAFIGPSLPRASVRAPKNVHVRAPVRRGDLAICRADYDIFVIIDGEFAQSLSVSPKEILTLLDHGKTVIGASSMGALRASELHTFGMIGVGWVYERFVRASVRLDDDVALCFSPTDFRALTIPMVDIEYWLDGLLKTNVISRHDRSLVLRKARSIFYADRTRDRLDEILRAVFSGNILPSLLPGMAGDIVSIKSIDAERALALAATLASSREGEYSSEL